MDAVTAAVKLMRTVSFSDDVTTLQTAMESFAELTRTHPVKGLDNDEYVC